MSDENDDPTSDTFGHRHGVTIMTIVLFGLLATVMLIQVAC
jgi:hypothetical protein